MYNSEWFKNLNRPFLAPPDSVLAPVWTVLYIMIFASLFLFLRTQSVNSKKVGIIFFVIQLLLNFAWSPTFFVYKNILLALIILILLIIFIILTYLSFKKVSNLSAYLLIPYFLWCCFALYLNSSYLWLN